VSRARSSTTHPCITVINTQHEHFSLLCPLTDSHLCNTVIHSVSPALTFATEHSTLALPYSNSHSKRAQHLYAGTAVMFSNGISSMRGAAQSDNPHLPPVASLLVLFALCSCFGRAFWGFVADSHFNHRAEVLLCTSCLTPLANNCIKKLNPMKVVCVLFNAPCILRS